MKTFLAIFIIKMSFLGDINLSWFLYKVSLNFDLKIDKNIIIDVKSTVLNRKI